MTTIPGSLSIPRIEAFLRERLTAPLPGPSAQQRFAPSPAGPDWAPDLRPETARRAAALVLLYPAASGPAAPLTVRHRGLPRHAGQVSLPGGAVAPGESVEAAALREAGEEIGVAARHIRLLGALSTLWIAASNFIVYPVIGVADTAPEFRLDPDEVTKIVEAPVAHLRDPAKLRWTRRPQASGDLACPYFDVGDEIV